MCWQTIDIDIIPYVRYNIYGQTNFLVQDDRVTNIHRGKATECREVVRGVWTVCNCKTHSQPSCEGWQARVEGGDG